MHEKSNYETADNRIIRCLHRGLAIESRPFITPAQELGTTEEELLEVIRSLIANGFIRRYGAVVRHEQVGYSSNVLVAWKIPEERIDQFEGVIQDLTEVSHGYERVSYPEWRYNVYTMIHGHSKDECLAMVKRISSAIKIKDYILLFTKRELKKRKLDLDGL
ncbi:MAG TPA: Lrp/AsnC family transcriptional regulator [Candidatus Bathyarchaeia archaeon]|nr:Lrp/AsnC family transcriptional regulator [Candidatus Bathyarchaeia archaeon]HYC19278.1 Lrp/AsnC family transcriptional regulator [Candidatus Bathyarchaeia archaeon]